MWSGTPLFPESASTMSSRVDALYFFLLAIAVFFTLLIAGLIIVYGIRFRRGLPDSVGRTIAGGAVARSLLDCDSLPDHGRDLRVGRERLFRDVPSTR